MANTLKEECGRLEATNRKLLEALKELEHRASLIHEIRSNGVEIPETAWDALYGSANKAKCVIALAEQREQWIIQSDEDDEINPPEKLYWSNILGWVDKDSATIFTPEEKRRSQYLPKASDKESHWVKVKE